ncbi:MAG: hypothetical protein GY851_10715 [bacterium]|nr:hypothetical protein [bacterium]
MNRQVSLTTLLAVIALTGTVHGAPKDEPRLVHDALWVWGNPEMAEEGDHSEATFAQAGPAERAAILGVPNIAMAGLGLPRDDEKAFARTAEVAHAPRLVWEIGGDDTSGKPSFEYSESIARVARVAKQYPQVEGVLLDDMTSVKIDQGFKPQHLRAVREELASQCPTVKLWGVVYTMNLTIPGIEDYIRELDVIHLWVWHAKDLVDVERHVLDLRGEFPDKPIVLGLYLYDFGDGRRMPLDVHQQQCERALDLLNGGHIRDLVFLTIENDEETVRQTAAWVQEVESRPIPARP